MPRAWSFFLIILLLTTGFSLFAQEDDEEDSTSNDSQWVDIVTDPYALGDKNFIISLGLIIPTYFSGIEDNQHGMGIGGTGALAFNYFLTSHIFLGGELSAMFAATRRGNMLYIIPFGARVWYQFWFKRFEIPLILMVGAAPEKYLEKGYIGLIVKPSASLFWRFNPDWSFGFNSAWWFVPQWPKNKNNVYGNFLELTLSARYHF